MTHDPIDLHASADERAAVGRAHNEVERLRAADVGLRALHLRDWESVHQWAQREDVCRHQPWGPNTPEQTHTFVQAAADAWEQTPQRRYAYAIEVDREVVGVAELHVLAHRQGEISYIVHPNLWGYGVATRAGRRLLHVGFAELGLHRVFGTCDPRNGASARVLSKLGMAYEGRLRENVLIKDGWRDSDLYGVLEREWRSAP